MKGVITILLPITQLKVIVFTTELQGLMLIVYRLVIATGQKVQEVCYGLIMSWVLTPRLHTDLMPVLIY